MEREFKVGKYKEGCGGIKNRDLNEECSFYGPCRIKGPEQEGKVNNFVTNRMPWRMGIGSQDLYNTDKRYLTEM